MARVSSGSLHGPRASRLGSTQRKVSRVHRATHILRKDSERLQPEGSTFATWHDPNLLTNIEGLLIAVMVETNTLSVWLLHLPSPDRTTPLPDHPEFQPHRLFQTLYALYPALPQGPILAVPTAHAIIPCCITLTHPAASRCRKPS